MCKLLTEQQVIDLAELGRKYAIASNLDPDIYVESMLNPDTIGDHDAGQIVKTLIRYHKDWLSKLSR
jgi:hypothetical protein